MPFDECDRVPPIGELESEHAADRAGADDGDVARAVGWTRRAGHGRWMGWWPQMLMRV